MTKKKTKTATQTRPVQFEWKGVKQVGDCRLWNDKNVANYYKLSEVAANVVGPGDIVDDLDPKVRYTFYLFTPSQSDDSARELDRLRRAGYFKCAAPRFQSPSGKFEERDGVLSLGAGIWYCVPYAKYLDNRTKARKEDVIRVAEAHASDAEAAKHMGMDASAETRNDLRGQRLR